HQARVAIDWHGVIRRGDAGSRRVERGTEREYRGDRGRRGDTLRRRGPPWTNRGELASRKNRHADVAGPGVATKRRTAAGLASAACAAEHAQSQQADAALDGEDLGHPERSEGSGP